MVAYMFLAGIGICFLLIIVGAVSDNMSANKAARLALAEDTPTSEVPVEESLSEEPLAEELPLEEPAEEATGGEDLPESDDLPMFEEETDE